MDLELKGKIAVVTGASAGIGRGIAKMLAAEGAQTVIIARRGALLASLQDEITRDGGSRPLAITADLNDRASPDRIRDEVLKQLGGVHVLVNNAGVSRGLPQDATDEQWDEAFAINFTPARKLTQAFLPTMQQQGWGRIINITGTMEPFGVGGAIVAKIGVDAWGKGLSRAIAKQGITINSIQPGRIHSEQVDTRLYPTKELQEQFANNHIPIGYFGEPDDVAYFVAYLCSPKARYLTGQRICIDGGLHFAI